MKILIVNDDSIYAPGIAHLAKAAAELGDVYVVAPARQCSALSQKLTLRETLTVEKAEEFPVKVKAAYKVGGTPVDCVKVALDYILKEKPDYVLSGINNGYNVGFDIAYSGTLGAAFEAARSGIPAIALSIAGDAHLEAGSPCLLPVLRELMGEALDPWTVWNVNFPRMNRGHKGILRDVPVATVSLYREKYIEVGAENAAVVLHNEGVLTEDEKIPAGSDAAAVREGYITVSKVKCTY